MMGFEEGEGLLSIGTARGEGMGEGGGEVEEEEKEAGSGRGEGRRKCFNRGEGRRLGSGVGLVFIGIKPPNSMTGGEGSLRTSPSLPSFPSTSSSSALSPSTSPSPLLLIFLFTLSSPSSSVLFPPPNNSLSPSIISCISSTSRNFVLPLLVMGRLGVLPSLLRVLLVLILSLLSVLSFLPSLSLTFSVCLFSSPDIAKSPSSLRVPAFRLFTLL